MSSKKIRLMVIVTVWIVAGCTLSPVSKAAQEQTPIHRTAVPAQKEPYQFSIATGTVESDWYKFGSGISLEINEQMPDVIASVKETKGLMENVDLLTSGKVGMALVYDYHVLLANHGRLMSAFPNAPMETITIKCGTEITRPMFPDYAEPARIVMPLYEQQVYIVASGSSGITSVNDLTGKHVSTGEPDSATEQQARFVIAGLGIDWKKEILHEKFDLAASIDALKNGRIDAFFWSGTSSAVEIIELLNTPDAQIALIPIDGKDAQQIQNTNPGIFHPGRIPAATFSGIVGEVHTLATTVVLAAMEDFHVDAVEQILASLLAGRTKPYTWLNGIGITPQIHLPLPNPEAQTYLYPGSIDYLAAQAISK